MAAPRLSPFFGNAYLLQAAQFLWQASVAKKRTYPLPEHALNATLFVALAAEAFINTALERVLGPEDAQALTRLRPVAERWTLGTHLVFGTPLLARGEEPHQSLIRLFQERNRLVHARSLQVEYFDFEAGTHLEVNEVARLLLRVSQAVDELGRQAPELEELRLVPQGLLRLDHHLGNYDPVRDAKDLHRVVMKLRVALAEHEFGTVEELVGGFDDHESELYWTREESIGEEFSDD